MDKRWFWPVVVVVGIAVLLFAGPIWFFVSAGIVVFIFARPIASSGYDRNHAWTSRFFGRAITDSILGTEEEREANRKSVIAWRVWMYRFMALLLIGFVLFGPRLLARM
jgi:hypothetical protein